MWAPPPGAPEFPSCLLPPQERRLARQSAARTAEGGPHAELAKLPTYYIMDAGQDMAQTVAAEMPSLEQVAACAWLPDKDLRLYVDAYARTGFQGALNWYRCRTEGRNADLLLFAGRTIDRCSERLHRRLAGLGHSPGTWNAGTHAGRHMHRHADVRIDRGSRTLGAAGKTRWGQRRVAPLPVGAAVISNVLSSLAQVENKVTFEPIKDKIIARNRDLEGRRSSTLPLCLLRHSGCARHCGIIGNCASKGVALTGTVIDIELLLPTLLHLTPI